jgi:NDP-sugar pyrophosphorylase family protein
MKRERITITLRSDLLDQIDGKIDKVKIRNRSHAIEYYLTRSLGSKISKTLILAGGVGTKMRPFTYEMPKTMIPIHGKPILEHTILSLRENHIKDIYISIDYLGSKICDYFGSGEKWGVNITYIDNKKPCGTAGALKSAKKYLTNDNFILIHGDVLAQIDIVDMIDFSQEENKILTMALTSIDDPSLYGSVRLRGAQVVEFAEKPKPTYQASRLINAGIYIAKPDIFRYINKSKGSLEHDVFPALINDKNIAGYHFAGLWFDISTPKNYERALKQWQTSISG